MFHLLSLMFYRIILYDSMDYHYNSDFNRFYIIQKTKRRDEQNTCQPIPNMED